MGDREYRVFVRVCPEPAAIVRDGLCRVIGPAFAALLGYVDTDIAEDLRIDDILAGRAEVCGTPLGSTDSAMARTGRSFLATLARADGTTIRCEVRSTAISFENRASELLLIRGVSRLHEAEAALRLSEAEHRSLFENMLEGIYQTKPDGTIVTANPALVRMLGYDSERQLYAETRAGEIYADPAQRASLLRTLDREGNLRNAELVLRRRDGSLITVLENARAVRNESGAITLYEGLLTDITERKHAQEALRITHEQLNATLDALPDLLFDIDIEGRIHDFRAPRPELLYLAPEKFLGKRVDQVLPEEASRVILGAIEEAAASRRSRGQIYSLPMGGEQRWFEISLAAKGDPKQPARRFIGLIRDITSRKLNEDRLEATTRELAAERTELSRMNYALNHVLENIERQKLDYRQQVYRDLERLILPPVRKLRSKAPRTMTSAVEELERTLSSVLAKDLDDYSRRMSGLTSRESQICTMIKKGLSSKQISDSLSLSLATVQKHREHIRTKLGLTRQGMNLATYLRVH